MRPTTCKTSITIAGYDCEATVTYVIHPGYPGSRIDPPEDASVEVTDIKLATSSKKVWAPCCHGAGAPLDPIPDWLFEIVAEAVEEDCLADDQGRADAAAEDRAELARDRAMEGQ